MVTFELIISDYSYKLKFNYFYQNRAQYKKNANTCFETWTHCFHVCCNISFTSVCVDSVENTPHVSFFGYFDTVLSPAGCWRQYLTLNKSKTAQWWTREREYMGASCLGPSSYSSEDPNLPQRGVVFWIHPSLFDMFCVWVQYRTPSLTETTPLFSVKVLMTSIYNLWHTWHIMIWCAISPAGIGVTEDKTNKRTLILWNLWRNFGETMCWVCDTLDSFYDRLVHSPERYEHLKQLRMKYHASCSRKQRSTSFKHPHDEQQGQSLSMAQDSPHSLGRSSKSSGSLDVTSHPVYNSVMTSGQSDHGHQSDSPRPAPRPTPRKRSTVPPRSLSVPARQSRREVWESQKPKPHALVRQDATTGKTMPSPSRSRVNFKDEPSLVISASDSNYHICNLPASTPSHNDPAQKLSILHKGGHRHTSEHIPMQTKRELDIKPKYDAEKRQIHQKLVTPRIVVSGQIENEIRSLLDTARNPRVIEPVLRMPQGRGSLSCCKVFCTWSPKHCHQVHMH